MPDLAYPAQHLTDGVVRLRPWTDEDVVCVEQAAQDPRIPQHTSVPARYTPEEGLAFIGRQRLRITRGEGVSLAVAAHHTDVALGLVILLRPPQPGVAGIGYWTVPGARGQGSPPARSGS